MAWRFRQAVRRADAASVGPDVFYDLTENAMTPLADMIPTMNDADLKSLRANAERLIAQGTPVQKAAAEDLIPLIDEQTALRAANKPVAVKKRAPAKKKVAPATGHQTALNSEAA